MSYRYAGLYSQSPAPPDASLGLIFRLNRLWERVDPPAVSGDFEKWDFWLDRIFCNLLYKNELEPVKDENGNIIGAKLDDDDLSLWHSLNDNVLATKEKLKDAKTKKEYHQAKHNLYYALMLKDVGLRKFMHQRLKLYMKEHDSNPSRAMWGG